MQPGRGPLCDGAISALNFRFWPDADGHKRPFAICFGETGLPISPGQNFKTLRRGNS